MRDIPLDNAKHEHFAQLVSNGESATQAYVLAGYSEKGAGQSAGRLLRNSEICSRLAYLRQQKEQEHKQVVQAAMEKVAIDKEWVLSQLVENVQMAKQATPVLDSEGKPIGEYKQNLQAANQALTLIGKEIGMFIDRKEVGRPGDFADLTDDELERQLADADRALAESERAIRAARGQAAQTAAPAGKAAAPGKA